MRGFFVSLLGSPPSETIGRLSFPLDFFVSNRRKGSFSYKDKLVIQTNAKDWHIRNEKGSAFLPTL
jgi:hypothetical protein